MRKHGKEAVKSGFQALLESKKLQRGSGHADWKRRRVDILDD